MEMYYKLSSDGGSLVTLAGHLDFAMASKLISLDQLQRNSEFDPHGLPHIFG